jgi:hypothetical protein
MAWKVSCIAHGRDATYLPYMAQHRCRRRMRAKWDDRELCVVPGDAVMHLRFVVESAHAFSLALTTRPHRTNDVITRFSLPFFGLFGPLRHPYRPPPN